MNHPTGAIVLVVFVSEAILASVAHLDLEIHLLDDGQVTAVMSNAIASAVNANLEGWQQVATAAQVFSNDGS